MLEEVGEKLGVRYLISGLIALIGDETSISVDLQSAPNGSLVWSDRFRADIKDIQQARQTIVASVVAHLEVEVPHYEVSQVRRLTSSQLDAWSHFHLGLSHIYKFKERNAKSAEGRFQLALCLAPCVWAIDRGFL